MSNTEIRLGGSAAPANTAAGKNTRFNNNNNNNPTRAAFGQLNGRLPEINTEELDLDNLEIATDGSERERRTLEDEIRRGMGELERRGDSSATSSNGVEMEGTRKDSMDFRARMEDESEASSRDSNSEVEQEDNFSLHIGMTRSRQPATTSGTGAVPLDEDLTYLTLSTTPASPRRFAAPPLGGVRSTNNNNNPASAPLSRLNPSAAQPRSLRKEFERADNTRGPSAPAVFGENIPLSSAPLPSSAKLRPAATSAPNNPPSSLPRAPSRLATFPPRSATAGSVFFQARDEVDSDSPDDRAGRMRLPDVTGLTEGLMSPAKVLGRGHRPVAEEALRGEGKLNNFVCSALLLAQEGNVIDMWLLLLGNKVSDALDQLRKRLASLERENSISASRVRELESKLGHEEQQNREANAAAKSPNSSAHVRNAEWETKLQEEQERREGVLSPLSRLRSHVTDSPSH